MKSPERRLAELERRLPAPAESRPNLAIPNIIDFVVGSEFLDRPHLYPRQATLLKVMFLADDLFTDYDLAVLEEWGVGVAGLESGSQYGLSSDLLTRIRINRDAGRKWFREVVVANGRRGGKGYLGAIAVSFVLWDLLAGPSSRERFGVSDDKTLTIQIFAVDRSQSKEVFFRDLVEVLTSAPCFAPFIADVKTDRVAIWSSSQVHGDKAPGRPPAFEIVAREATAAAARGYASPVLAYDEMAHAVATGAARSAEEIYAAATPAQAQFGLDAFSYLPSSPRHQTGLFYELHEQGLRRTASGGPEFPQTLSIQMPSWALYQDWERWSDIPLYPGGPTSAPLTRAIVAEEDPDLEKLRRTNPEMYNVEYRARWAHVLAAYLPPEVVHAICEPYEGQTLIMQARRTDPTHVYVGHVDLGVVDDNAAVIIGHSEKSEDPSRPHFVIDFIKCWRPQEFPEGRIQLAVVESEITSLALAFGLRRLTFDHYQSEAMIQNLKAAFRRRGMTRSSVTAISNTRQDNRDKAEVTKTALYEGRVHAPRQDLLEQELLFLHDDGMKVDHPTTGPVTSNDLAVCLFEVVGALTEFSKDPGLLFSGVAMRGLPLRKMTSEERYEALRDFGASRGIRYRRLQGGTTARPRKRPRYFRS